MTKKPEEELNQDNEFRNIDNFDELKRKVFDMNKTQIKTNNDIIQNKNLIELLRVKCINNTKSNDESHIISEKTQNENKQLIEDTKKILEEKLENMDNKIKKIFGNIGLENTDTDNKNPQKSSESKHKKSSENNTTNAISGKSNGRFFNFDEIKRRLTNLTLTKTDKTELEAHMEKVHKQIDDVNKRITDLITGLFGPEKDEGGNDNTRRIGFVTLNEFDRHKASLKFEFNNIWIEIRNIRSLIDKINEELKKKAGIIDLEDTKSYILKKLDELVLSFHKKYADKVDTASAIKTLDEKINKLLYIITNNKPEHDGENWLLAKKPVGGFSCAACESLLGELKDVTSKYIPWNKMPLRESGDKLYRMANGYSRILQKVNVDNSGNITVNAGDFNFGDNIKTNSRESTIERGSENKNIEKDNDTIELHKNPDVYDNKYEKKLPKIRCSMSSESMERICNRNNNSNSMKNINLNKTSAVGLSPKITKIMRKTQTKFDN